MAIYDITWLYLNLEDLVAMMTTNFHFYRAKAEKQSLPGTSTYRNIFLLYELKNIGSSFKHARR